MHGVQRYDQTPGRFVSMRLPRCYLLSTILRHTLRDSSSGGATGMVDPLLEALLIMAVIAYPIESKTPSDGFPALLADICQGGDCLGPGTVRAPKPWAWTD